MLCLAAVMGAAGTSWWLFRRAKIEPPRAVAVRAGSSAWADVLRGVRPGEPVPKEVALRAFSLVYNAAIPGVEGVPARDSSVPFCGVGPLLWVKGYWGSLSGEQRAAIERAAGPMLGAPRASSAAEVRAGDGEATRHLDLVRGTLALLREKLHRDLGDHVVVHWDPTLRPVAGARPTDWDIPLDQNTECQLYLGPALQGETRANLQAAIAHELFHCYQFTMEGAPEFDASRAGWAHPTGWTVEGSAMWAGEAAVNGSQLPVAAFNWNFYFQGRGGPSEWSIYASDYDAVGFYSHLARHGVDVWARVLDVRRRGMTVDAFRYMVEGHEEMLSSFASSALRRPEWGAAWNHLDPIIPSAARTRREPETWRPLRQGTPMTLHADAGTQHIYTIPIASGDVVTLRATGIGRATFDAEGDVGWTSTFRKSWCRNNNGCRCPDGTSVPGLQSIALPAPLTVALFGAVPGGTDVTLEAQPVDELCHRDERVDPCLLGHWCLCRSEMQRNVANALASAGFESIRGRMTLDVSADRTLAVTWNNFQVTTNASGVRTEVTLNGHATGSIETSGETFTSRHVSGSPTITGSVSVGAMRMPLPPNATGALGRMFELPQGSQLRYTCTPDRFSFQPSLGDGRNLNIVYLRTCD